MHTGGQFAKEPRAESDIKLPDYSWETTSPTWNELRACANDPSISDEDYQAMLLAKVHAHEERLAGGWSIYDCTPEQLTAVETYRHMAFDWAEPKVGLVGLDSRYDAEAFSCYAVRRIVAADYDLGCVPGMEELLKDFDHGRAVERAKGLCRGSRQEQWVEQMSRFPGLGRYSFGRGTYAMRAQNDAAGFVERLRQGGVMVRDEPNGPRGAWHWRIVGTTDPELTPSDETGTTPAA